jgi:succinyl-diaminopimelate desuccinylase
MSAALQLAMELIRRPSVTPEDAGCQRQIGDRLRALDFTVHPLRFGEVDNLWARRGTAGPLLVFAGHTDVVPPGPLHDWLSDPFAPEIRDGLLYGRGAADMKGGLAAAVTAIEAFVHRHPHHTGSLGMLLTSDEEGPSIDGTVKVMEWLAQRGERIDWCILGEPSSVARAGDEIKVGRRGSLNGSLEIEGIQGHVAYPHLAHNPIHTALPALAELVALEWDRGNDFFPPSSLQISNLEAGTGAENVIPGRLRCLFNIRFSTEQTAAGIEARIRALLDRHQIPHRLEFRCSGHPFLTQHGALVAAVAAECAALTGTRPRLSTGGGTSDGRFIAPTGAEVVELGPSNATIHKVNECVAVHDLAILHEVYLGCLTRLLPDPGIQDKG